MSNLQALSPLKRSSSISQNDNFGHAVNRYESFASKFKSTKNELSQSYNSPNALRMNLSNAGNNVMRNSYNKTMKIESKDLKNDYSNNAGRAQNGAHSNNSFQKRTQENPSMSYQANSMMNDMPRKSKFSSSNQDIPVQKSSFYSEQNPNYRKKFSMSDSKIKGGMSNHTPYGNNTKASNSDGFIETAVSTPLYQKVSAFQDKLTTKKYCFKPI